MRRFFVAAGVAATLAVAGCGSTAASPLDNARLSAAETIEQSAQRVEQVTSYSADFVVDFSSAQAKGLIEGAMRYQKTPQPTSEITLDQASYAGQTLPGGVRAILRGDVAYVKADALKSVANTSKPWIKVDLTRLGPTGGASVSQVFDQVLQIDLATSVALLTASKDVAATGTEQVNGVDTTHYSGTFPVEEAAKQLPPQAQEHMKRGFSQLRKVKFDAWIDRDGLPRKIRFTGDQVEPGVAFTATAFFKGFNASVTIATPPADQIGEIPRPHGG